MFESGIFPDFLKIARVCPIHKEGHKHLLTNYRPVSVLPVLSKVFESALNVRLQKFFNKYNVISDMQYGFQKKKSCEGALLNIKHEMISVIENRMYTLGLFVDLRKTFDSVCHSLLNDKLEKYGVRGNALKLLSHYLTNRYQYVSINNDVSTYAEITTGVPQG